MTPDIIPRPTPPYPNRRALETWLCREGIGHAEHDLTEPATTDC